MFTFGSKFFFGLAAVAAVAGGIYWVNTNLEFFGTIVLLSLAAVAAFLGAITIAFRDAEIDAPAVEALSGADAEGLTRGPRVSPSVWPIVGAFGAGLVVIGLVYDRRWFIAGLIVIAATIIEWMVQAWADRASDDPAYNATLRGRILHPLEFPILGALGVGLVIFGFSRLMLAIPKSAAIGAFIGLGALVLVIAALLSAPRRLSGAVAAVVLVLGGVGILTAGVVSAATGERNALRHPEEETGPTKKTSNKVADKANALAQIVVDPSGMTPMQLTIPRSAAVNLLFDNEDNVPRQLVVTGGQQPKLDASGQQVKDANGNVITVPIEFRTDYIGKGKTAILTVTMPLPGQFTFRTQTGDNLGVTEGKVTVP
jgi:hypothetical protein